MTRAIFLIGLVASVASGQVKSWRPAVLSSVGIDQKMGAQVPLDVPFADESGHTVTLKQYLGKPVILALVYYQCPSLCNMVLNGVERSLRSISMNAGDEFNVVAVSFDSRETPEMAAAKKAMYMKGYDRPHAQDGWHFLTGAQASSKMLADAVGFHFAYDPMSNQFAHGSAIMILTPDGKVARYYYGIEYPARDVRFGLEEAANHQIASPVDQVLLYCYHYDPSTGKYGFVIMSALRLAGIATVGSLAIFIIVCLRRDFGAKVRMG